MKKILLFFLFLFFLLIFFNKILLSKIIILNLSRIIERPLIVSKVDINYNKKEIIFNSLQVPNDDRFFYQNIFEANKIIIKYKFKSLFTNLIEIESLVVKNSKIFLEFDNQVDLKKIIDDNVNIIEKLNEKYKPIIYKNKKKDKNFIISIARIKNTKVFMKTLDNKNNVKIKLSDMDFFKISNSQGYQHYKDIFKIILTDIFFKVPDIKFKKLLKKNYNL